MEFERIQSGPHRRDLQHQFKLVRFRAHGSCHIIKGADVEAVDRQLSGAPNCSQVHTQAGMELRNLPGRQVSAKPSCRDAAAVIEPAASPNIEGLNGDADCRDRGRTDRSSIPIL